MLPQNLSHSRDYSQSMDPVQSGDDDVSERNQSEKSKKDEPISHSQNFSFNALPKPNFFLDGVSDPNQRSII